MSFTTQKQTFASWQELHFSSAELSMDSVSSMIAAPANDRISNLMKYALGLNPLIACSGTTVGMPLMGTTTTGSNRYLSLKFSGTAPDISYNVQASSDLSTWTTIQSWTPGFPPGTQTVSDTVPISSTSKRFIRLQVIGP